MLVFASCVCKPSATAASHDADICFPLSRVSELPEGSGPYYRMLDLPAFSGSASAPGLVTAHGHKHWLLYPGNYNFAGVLMISSAAI